MAVMTMYMMVWFEVILDIDGVNVNLAYLDMTILKVNLNVY